jgi:hydrogenase expression/formation protein HypC
MSNPQVGMEATEPAHCVGDVCITCSDVAVPVRIMSLHGYELATVRTEAGTDEEISVALVDAVVGDIVLVHAKEAIARIDSPPDGPGMEHRSGMSSSDEP